MFNIIADIWYSHFTRAEIRHPSKTLPHLPALNQECDPGLVEESKFIAQNQSCYGAALTKLAGKYALWNLPEFCPLGC